MSPADFRREYPHLAYTFGNAPRDPAHPIAPEIRRLLRALSLGRQEAEAPALPVGPGAPPHAGGEAPTSIAPEVSFTPPAGGPDVSLRREWSSQPHPSLGSEWRVLADCRCLICRGPK